jgi:hypothetical protein
MMLIATWIRYTAGTTISSAALARIRHDTLGVTRNSATTAASAE